MKITVKWNNGMAFTGETDGHSILMDSKAPLGQNSGFTPKELLVVALGGCTAMDVIALLKKNKQPVDSFVVETEAESSTGKAPWVLTSVVVHFKLYGQIDPEKIFEAVHLSQSKYCGVSNVVAHTTPIHYKICLNDQFLKDGQAEFEGTQF